MSCKYYTKNKYQHSVVQDEHKNVEKNFTVEKYYQYLKFIMKIQKNKNKVK